MRKYLELFKDGFDATIAEKIRPENKPYVGYSPSEGVVFTVIPEPVAGPANNEIWYTTTTGEVTSANAPLNTVFGLEVVSHTYENGKGILVMSSDITQFAIGGSFANNIDLQTIHLPNTISIIPAGTFHNCPNLEVVILGAGVQTIEDNAFGQSPKLREINLPEGLTTMNQPGLKDGSIKKITIPGSLKDIDVACFIGCLTLESVIINEGIEIIYQQAFGSCAALKEVVLPSTLQEILYVAFAQCSSLTSITYNGTVEQWNAIDKMEEWNADVPATYVQCSDGQVTL